MYASYIVNAPNSVYVPWTIVKTFLEETTVRKFSIYSDSYPTPLISSMCPHLLEKKYGGQAENKTCNFWYFSLFSCTSFSPSQALPSFPWSGRGVKNWEKCIGGSTKHVCISDLHLSTMVPGGNCRSARFWGGTENSPTHSFNLQFTALGREIGPPQTWRISLMR